MSFGDGVDPVEDLLLDKQMAVHNLHVAVDARDATIAELRAKLSAAERERDEALAGDNLLLRTANECRARAGAKIAAKSKPAAEEGKEAGK